MAEIDIVYAEPDIDPNKGSVTSCKPTVLGYETKARKEEQVLWRIITRNTFVESVQLEFTDAQAQFFNNNGAIVSGWVPITFSPYDTATGTKIGEAFVLGSVPKGVTKPDYKYSVKAKQGNNSLTSIDLDPKIIIDGP